MAGSVFVSDEKPLTVSIGVAQLRLADDAMTVGMRWEAAGVTGGLFPVLDANIRVSGDGQRSQLGLTACYRLPFGAAGAGLDPLLLHKVATATIHAFLARVASALPATHEAAAETATSSWWPPGQPEPAPNTGS